MILTDTVACHIELNKIKTLKADSFMENAAMFKAFLLNRYLLSPCFVPSALLDRKDTTTVSKENIIWALCIQVQEAENKSEKN